ncbi:MAG: PaaI family thioesterase [Ilumatobacteraceae bacterium]
MTTREPLVTATELNAHLRKLFGQDMLGLTSDMVTEMEYGMVVTTMEVGEKQLRPGRIISGPTVFAACDAALFYACLSVYGLDMMMLTSDMQIRFLRPAKGTRLHARGRILSVGSKLITGQVVAFTDDESKPVAVAQGSCVPPKKPVES